MDSQKERKKERNQVTERDREHMRLCGCVLTKAAGGTLQEGQCVYVQHAFEYLLCPVLCLLPRLPRNAQTCPFRHRGKNRNKKKGGIIRTQAPNSFKNGFYLYKSLHIPNTVIS